jgi:hypothetical protein
MMCTVHNLLNLATAAGWPHDTPSPKRNADNPCARPRHYQHRLLGPRRHTPLMT